MKHPCTKDKEPTLFDPSCKPRRPLPLVMGCCLMLAAGNVAADLEIPLATGEWPPYIGSTLPGNGMLGEIVSATLALMQAKPRYTFTSWPRAEQLVEKGLVFAALPYVQTEERAYRFDFSDTLNTTQTVLFYSKTQFTTPPRIAKPEELKPYLVGTARGYWYDSWLTGLGVRLSYASDEIQALQQLQLGRVQFVPAEETMGWFLIRQHLAQHAAQFAAVDKPLDSSKSNHLLVSRSYPGHAELLQRFNHALATLKRNGDYRRIVQRYQPSVEANR